MVGAPLAALLDTLGVRQVDVVGYSLGGDVALQTAIRHPDRVGRLVAISAPFARDGFFPEVVETFAQMEAHAPAIAANVQHSPRATMYPDVRWETLFRKIGALNGAAFDWSDAISHLTTPTRLVFADADAIRPEHVVEFYRRLGGGQRDAGQDGAGRSPNRLAIIPGTTHYNVLASELAMRVVTDFFAR